MLINDITKHRRAEKLTRESEERLRKFFDATSEGIVFSEGGIVSDCNGAGAHMMRLSIFKTRLCALFCTEKHPS